MSLLKSNYYDHPEGTDFFGKMVATNKYAAGTALLWGTMDVLMLSKTQGYLKTLARYGYNVGPAMGMATAFTLATYVATNTRGKDDRINYFLGGMAAGGIYGCWRHSIVSGLTAGLFLGAAATLKKLSKQEGWDFFPEIRHESGSLRGSTHDFTLMKDPAKNA